MLFVQTNLLNRNVQLAVSSAESGNSFVVANIRVDPSQQLELYGITWGCAVLSATDRTNFALQNYYMYLDNQIDFTNTTFVSRSNPDPTQGEVLNYRSENEPGIFYDDFAIPWIIPPSRSVQIIVPQPLLTLAAAGSMVLSLTVRGDYKPNQPGQIGNRILRS